MKNEQAGSSIDLVQDMLGLCARKDGTKAHEPLQAGEGGYGKNMDRC